MPPLPNPLLPEDDRQWTRFHAVNEVVRETKIAPPRGTIYFNLGKTVML